jgi:hypothetical protein
MSTLGSEDGREEESAQVAPEVDFREDANSYGIWNSAAQCVLRSRSCVAIHRQCHKEQVVQERPSEDGRKQLLQVHRMQFPTGLHFTVPEGVRRMGDLGERQDKTDQLPKRVLSIVPPLEHEFSRHSDRVPFYYPR